MKYLFTLIFIGVLQFSHAQFDTIYIAVLPFHTTSPKSQDFVDATKAYVTEILSQDYRFVLVERDEFDAVMKEREYQKSEEFIDGKIVEQGKAVGADFLFEGYYEHAINKLTFNVFDVSNGSLRYSIVADQARTEKEKGLMGAIVKGAEFANRMENNSALKRNSMKPTRYIVRTNIEKLVDECFPEKAWVVLRPVSETDSKVKELLIAAGSRMGLKKGTIIEVQALITEEVNGETIERLESAGWGRVIKVESDYFSILKLESGTKNIKKHLKAGRELKCRYIKK